MTFWTKVVVTPLKAAGSCVASIVANVPLPMKDDRVEVGAVVLSGNSTRNVTSTTSEVARRDPVMATVRMTTTLELEAQEKIPAQTTCWNRRVRTSNAVLPIPMNFTVDIMYKTPLGGLSVIAAGADVLTKTSVTPLYKVGRLERNDVIKELLL